MTIQDWLGENNTLGIDIWEKKYRRGDESFDQWLDRISNGNEDVKQLIIDKKFLFGGRILSNRNVSESIERVTYSNCYVISPPEDSIESIYETCKKLARTYSYGGGCGIDISKLAPAGARVHNQAKTTSGAVSFMDTFSQVTEQIGQNGRRGALMISLDCHHPDIEKFITLKSDLSKVNYANISVRVTNDFMHAVEEDGDWELTFTRPETNETITKTVRANDLFNLLCEQNWNYAEPGILFWDTITSQNMLNTHPEFEYAGTNPCAEEPLPAGGSCLLGSLNLAAFVKQGDFLWSEFGQAIHIAVRALNEVLDEGLHRHPLEEQRKSVRDWRQIGLGIMGLADMLIEMNITYGSDEALKISDKIGDFLARKAILASTQLAEEYQTPYPKYIPEVADSNFLQYHYDYKTSELIKQFGLYNSQLLTIAPTGTLSTMLGISGGIEPIFANSYTRTTKSLHGKDVTYKVYTPIVDRYMKANNITDEEDLPEWFITSADIEPINRVKMQGIWQRHIDASISSTVNLPHEATVDDVRSIYWNAWQCGLKGITVFRAGCARVAILNATPEEKKEKEPVEEETKIKKVVTQKGTSDCLGMEHHLTTGCGSLHITAFFDKDGNLRNTYLSKGSTGGCNNFMIGLSRMISLAARNGTPIEEIVDQLKSSGTCPSYAVRRATKNDVSPGSCCPVAIGNALMEMWEKFNNEYKTTAQEILTEKCPQCGADLKHEMGCVTCTECGYSKCG